MEIYEILAIIISVITYSEIRYKSMKTIIDDRHNQLHKCVDRIESTLDEHIKDAKNYLERFYKLEAEFLHKPR